MGRMLAQMNIHFLRLCKPFNDNYTHISIIKICTFIFVYNLKGFFLKQVRDTITKIRNMLNNPSNVDACMNANCKQYHFSTFIFGYF